MRKTLILLALAPLIGCAPIGPSATLPPGALDAFAEPTRSTILSSAYAFNNPGGLADPAVAARAAANLEFLAASIPHDARYNFAPSLLGQLNLARAEMHRALGVADDAPPQVVVDSLYGAARALALHDAAAAEGALPARVFPNRQATLLRLASLGPLPLSANATAVAEQELLRAEQDRVNSTSGGGGSSGRD